MKKLRWQLIIIFLTGMVVGVLLLSEQSSSEELYDMEPVKGGIYTEALIGSPQRYNPVLDYYNSVDRDVNRLIFNGLLRFDSRGAPQPDLAESWGVSKDGTIYNFTLRSGIKWHDGKPLTTADIQFTIELLREGEGVVPDDLREFWSEVDVIPLSNDSIQFKLPEAFSPFPDYLTFGILPEHLLADLTFEQIIDDEFNLNPVGSGPYKFERLIVDGGQITGIVLAANEDYYLDPPYIENIIFRYYPDSYSALEAYQDGMVQGIGEVSDDILSDVLAAPDLNVYTGRKSELTMILFNLNNPQTEFLQEADIRKALLSGLNRQWMVDNLLNGQAIVADNVILPGTWAYYEGVENIDYDVDKAILTLKEAGYNLVGENTTVRSKDDLLFSFELIYPDEPGFEDIANTVKDNWAKIGVEVTLAPLPYEEIINSRLQARSFEAALVSLNLSLTPDPDPYPFWDQAQATGGQNYSQWDNRMASDYLEQARVTMDMTERARLYRNFQVIFADEMPALPLYFPVYSFAVSSEVQGVSMGPLFDTSDRFTTVREWFMITRSPVFEVGETQ